MSETTGVTFDKEMRAIQKRDGVPLIVLGVDDLHGEGFTFRGPASREHSKLVWDLFLRIAKERRAEKKPRQKKSKPFGK